MQCHIPGVLLVFDVAIGVKVHVVEHANVGSGLHSDVFWAALSQRRPDMRPLGFDHGASPFRSVEPPSRDAGAADFRPHAPIAPRTSALTQLRELTSRQLRDGGLHGRDRRRGNVEMST
jgi:hypothetical protein